MRNLKKLLEYIGIGIEELILIGIIALNILDFAEMLSPDWDYAKKILSWTALGYLLYRASPTNVFFGRTYRKLDLALIVSYFLFSFKLFIGYAESTIQALKKEGFSYWGNLFTIDKAPANAQVINIQYPIETANISSSEQIMISTDISNQLNGMVEHLSIEPTLPPSANEMVVNLSNNVSSQLIEVESKFSVHRWLNFLLDNPEAAYNFSILAGIFMVIIIAIYCSFKIKIEKPSMMEILLGGKNKNLILRFLAGFFVINFFFVVIFNLVMEWLAISIDAPIIVMALFFYLLLWIKHHTKFNSESFIYKVGNFGTDFYQNFVHLLKTRKGILLGMSGMLVLHLLTDLGIFMVPYTTGIHDSLYLEQLGAGHNPVFSYEDVFGEEKESLMAKDFTNTQGVSEQLMTAYIYLGNVIALLLILLLPAILWYSIFTQKHYRIKNITAAIFFGSFLCLILAPVFRITRINTSSLIGVDIKTQSLLQTAQLSMPSVFLISLAVLVITYILCLTRAKKFVVFSVIMISLIYFAYYILLYFIDIFIYYSTLIGMKFAKDAYIVGSYFALFMLITALFYVAGFFSYLYELVNS
ncbi:MAG: hypothetical protein ACOCZ6_04780 [Nanoarchaeota archaeon]